MATALGATTQGSVGIGLALVAGPALVAIDASFAPGPLLLGGVVIGVRHVMVDRAHFDAVTFRRSVMGLPFGLAGGLLLLSILSDQAVAVTVGGVTVITALILLAGARIRPNATSDILGGGGATLAAVTAGTPGPALVIAFSHMDPPRLRSTASALALVIAAFGLAGMLATGEYGRHEVTLTAWMLPGVLLGLLVARIVRPLVERRWFRPTILVIALVGGVALLVGQLT